MKRDPGINLNDSPAEESGIIFGRNSVVELLKSNSAVDTVFITNEMQENQASYYIALANDKKAIVKRVPAAKLDSICGNKHHQGIAASASFCDYCSVDDILQYAADKGESPFIILTDGIEDPHNLGAIIRTAECAGVHGVIIPKRGNASVNATVHRAAAGATSHIKIARVSNLSNEIRKLKQKGIFFYCADMDGAYCYKTDLRGPIGLVIGSEGFGVSRLVKELCDVTIALPMYGNVNSLNASAAASAIIYEIIRQRNFKE